MSTQTDQAEDLVQYELMLIFSGELPEAEFEKQLADVRKMLSEGSKGISHEDLWGRKDFVYRIKKQRRGYYVIFNFSAQTGTIAEIRTNIKLNPAVLRHLLIAVPENYDPEKYKHQVLREERGADDERRKRVSPRPAAAPPARAEELSAKPIVAGKEEEEQLKTVEKKLEKILENPDIDIR